MKTVLITGANRGIGLEFCRHYLNKQWQVFACCRQPDLSEALNKLAMDFPSLRIVKLDVRDHHGIETLARQLNKVTLDLLIANAGVYGDSSEHGFGNIAYPKWSETIEINVFGATKVAEAFLPHLKSSKCGKIVAISSQMGSIDDNSSGGSMLYRSSKAALNAVMKSISVELKEDNIGVLIFHPGWVKTDMGGPNALIDATTSVQGMIEQIDSFALSNTGRFIKYDGTEIAW